MGYRALLLAPLVLAAGCAVGGFADAGSSTRDAPLDDSGSADAGVDAGPVDAGPRDAGAPDSGPPDAGPTCAESPCRLQPPECGCPAGQSCRRLMESTRYCSAIGAGMDGDACADDPDCAAGFECAGQCLRYCNDDSDCAGDGSRCTRRVLDSAGNPIAGGDVCSVACDPLTSAGCSGGRVCRIEDLGGPYTHCGTAGSIAPLQSCTQDSDCGVGHECTTGPMSPGTFCLAYCIDDFDCPGFLVCYGPIAIIGGVTYGTCG